MGIPSYYRWLCKKYPRVPIDARGDEEVLLDGKIIPTDTSTPNPNDIEFDNLYLDMNGIIHPCCHPESGEAPPTEEEMFLKIHKYIDRIFSIVRPRKVLYMAIDGVAPRAKMNQQRQRRFRAAQERAEFSKLDDELRALFQATGRGHILPPKKGPAWDSNVITPGTPFMANLSESLRYYIADRLQNDPGWKDLQVIFSDATVPGEGEHKILHFIRNQRSQPGANPNTVHCLYGMDADLIMLSLASHEPHFYIVREIVFSRAEMVCTTCGRGGHHAGECQGLDKDTVIRYADSSLDHYISHAQLLKYQAHQSDSVITIRKRNTQPYQFLSIAILRQYLEHELDFGSQFYDLERAIDDWVFLCFFVGNDFLPHMPALEIRENAIGVMQKIWKSIIMSNVRSQEDKIVNSYWHSLPKHEKQRVDRGTLTSADPKVKAFYPVTEEMRDEVAKTLYLTYDGEINLEGLHAFLQKFQLFEAAILFSKNKKNADAERKQQRVAAERARDEENAKIIAADNQKLEEEVDVQGNNNKNNKKNKRKATGKAAATTTTATSTTYESDGDDDDVVIVSQAAGGADDDNKASKKQKTQNSTDKNDEDLVQLQHVDADKLALLQDLLQDCDQKELHKAEQFIQGKSDIFDSDESSDDSPLSKLLPPGDEDVEGETTTELQLPTPAPPGAKPNNKAKKQKKQADEVKFDLKTGQVREKIGEDYHTALPETDPFKKKRGKNTKLRFGDEYSKTNPFIEYTAALNKLKERLGEAPKGDILDKEGKPTDQQHGEDTIKLGSKGYEWRYYKQKFHTDITSDRPAFDHIHLSYITGLRWVFHYYYKGCPSWNWYYPYHHAPLITSLAKIPLESYYLDVSTPINPTNAETEKRPTNTIITTSLYSNAQPILPFEQLLSVFPAASSHALPPPLARMMVEADSPIADFYPQEFGLDTMNKKFMWQGIVLLPFIDMERLKRSVRKVEHLMTADELERNRHGMNYVFSRYEANDESNTNNTALIQVELEAQQHLEKLQKATNYTQKLQVYAPPGSTEPKQTITVREVIDQFTQLNEKEKMLRTLGRKNKAELAKIQTEVIPQRTILYRTIRGFFDRPSVEKPAAPITANRHPNDNEEWNATLEKTSAHTQFTHDISQWQYNYASITAVPALTALMLSKITRIVEPSLAQHTQVFAKSVCEKTNLISLQGYFGLMCDQITPGMTIIPSPAYQTPNDDLKPIENVQVVSYIFTTPPARKHLHKLLPGARVIVNPYAPAEQDPTDAKKVIVDNRASKTLNEKDFAEIGIYKQRFGEFTFEYLYSLIKDKNVYQTKDSQSKDVQSFDQLGLDEYLTDSNSNPTDPNASPEDEVTLFDRMFAGQMQRARNNNGGENFNVGEKHSFQKRQGTTHGNFNQNNNNNNNNNNNRQQQQLTQEMQQQQMQTHAYQQQQFHKQNQNNMAAGYQPPQMNYQQQMLMQQQMMMGGMPAGMMAYNQQNPQMMMQQQMYQQQMYQQQMLMQQQQQMNGGWMPQGYPQQQMMQQPQQQQQQQQGGAKQPFTHSHPNQWGNRR